VATALSTAVASLLPETMMSRSPPWRVGDLDGVHGCGLPASFSSSPAAHRERRHHERAGETANTVA
jgi:hypothetical protein